MQREKIENDMIDSMWSFLQMGGLKSNYPALEEACMELRQMMMQKTAGQTKYGKATDISFDNLERVKATIIVEAMALVLSGDYENPVVYAYWEECKTTATVPGVKIYRCSACGRTVKERVGINVYEVYPYCHCGAKMDERMK